MYMANEKYLDIPDEWSGSRSQRFFFYMKRKGMSDAHIQIFFIRHIYLAFIVPCEISTKHMRLMREKKPLNWANNSNFLENGILFLLPIEWMESQEKNRKLNKTFWSKWNETGRERENEYIIRLYGFDIRFSFRVDFFSSKTWFVYVDFFTCYRSTIY